MNFLPSKISALVGVLALGGIAQAQTATQATTTPPTPLTTQIAPEDQKALDEAKRLVSTVQLWNEPLDWKETGASTAEIVAHIRKALGAKAPLIEVRGKDTSRLTFALEKEPLGPMMWSLADLANAGMWVFPGRLVLAPESALTAAERVAIKEGKGGEWQGDLPPREVRWNPHTLMDSISLSIVGTEIKTRLAAKGTTASVPAPPAPAVAPAPATNAPRVVTMGQDPLAYRLPLAELNPAVQQVVQDLYDLRYPFMGARIGLPKTLPASTMVEFDDTRPTQMQIHLDNPQLAQGDWHRDLGRWFVTKRTPSTAQ